MTDEVAATVGCRRWSVGVADEGEVAAGEVAAREVAAREVAAEVAAEEVAAEEVAAEEVGAEAAGRAFVCAVGLGGPTIAPITAKTTNSPMTLPTTIQMVFFRDPEPLCGVGGM
jgi:hypothetical protein